MLFVVSEGCLEDDVVVVVGGVIVCHEPLMMASVVARADTDDGAIQFISSSL